MSLLEPSNFLAQAFWLIVFFIMQYWLMASFIIPAFKSTINGRKNYIHRLLKAADKCNIEANRLKDDYEAKLQKAKEKNIALMNQMTDQIKTDADSQLKALENELANDFKINELRIQKFIAESSGEIDKLATETAYNIISKLSDKKVSKTDLNKYIN